LFSTRRSLPGVVTNQDIEEATIQGGRSIFDQKPDTGGGGDAESRGGRVGISSDVMRPIAAPIVCDMITSTRHVLILVPVS
jgi:Cu(I)/Ag(I) efflux system membrane protein CusA/SilA